MQERQKHKGRTCERITRRTGRKKEERTNRTEKQAERTKQAAKQANKERYEEGKNERTTKITMYGQQEGMRGYTARKKVRNESLKTDSKREREREGEREILVNR